ncbi:hypothetical protein [Trabulsiella odontotermitis]|uniref:hypothetical protein n=1 Tax=Trabulsiella odontotermitis TaxID=379893 RepID=UPI000675CFAC|nr:hypothetical protein [Trabulsiella odontotermitis]KNC92567.1 hypothetical protein GM30_15815 [Trabulsiella odontotermitis]
MQLNKTAFPYLIFVCFYWFLVIFITVFLISLGVAIIFYLQDGSFLFSWWEELYYSLGYGLSAGIPLGVGCWFLSWMKERQKKQSPPKE